MQVLSASQAVACIQSGATLVSSGFRFAAAPEELLAALGDRFKDSGEPRDLRLVYSSAQGGHGAGRGLDHLAQPGMLREIIGGFYGSAPRLKALLTANAVEAWNLPQGQIAMLYRAIAAGQPGVITHVGLHTFVDPRIEGGRLTPRTKRDITEIVHIAGREWMFYPAFAINACLIRGTTADEFGNISIEKEAVRLEGLAIAMATRNSGGTVIVQVERLAKGRSLSPQRVEIPGHLVDFVTVCADPSNTHQQALDEVYNPAYNGEIVLPSERVVPMPFSLRKVIARRVSQFLSPGLVVNLGQGMPEGVGAIAQEAGIMDTLWTTLESGVIGGVPTKHVNFGVATNPMAIIRHDDQFAFYNGGGVDLSCLGFAEVDRHGAINVSRFGGSFTGAGGFIDICARTRQLVFCGMFEAGARIIVRERALEIESPGTTCKFVDTVEQVTFSAHHAVEEGRAVSLVTERAVFELTSSGWALREVAPGIRVQEDILDRMRFLPIVERVDVMRAELFLDDASAAA
jgi:propionate CoA-transferase